MSVLRTISVGDIHGRKWWKEIDPNKYDHIVFVGDYTDQFPPMSDEEIYNNLLDIIAFKKAYSTKVILLLGNHDIQYFFLNQGFSCSGFRPSMAAALSFLFKEERALFQIAFQIDNYLWTHAGVTNGWYDYNKKEIEEVAQRFETVNLADTLNHMLQLKENSLLHQVGRKRDGYYFWGGVTWADRAETVANYLTGYNQIVGHTPINNITTYGDHLGSITYIDVLNEVEYWHYKNGNDRLKSKNNKNYDDKIKEMFPDINLDKPKIELNITKFYELEITDSSQ